MEKDTKQFVHYAGALFLTVAAVAILWQMVGPSWFKNIKAEVTNQPYARTITVSGDGKVTTKPDIAMVSFSVATNAKTVKEVMDQGNQKMTQVRDALKKMGIEDKDLMTTQYDLQPKYSDVREYSITPYATPESFNYLTPSAVPGFAPKIEQPVSADTKPIPALEPLLIIPPEKKSLIDLLDELDITDEEAMQLYTAYISEKDTTKTLKLLDEFGVDSTDAAKLYAVFMAGEKPGSLMRAPRVPTIVAYTLNQTLQVKIRKLDDVDSVVDAAVKAGSNQVGQLYFDIDDMTGVQKEAREKAFKAALDKAQEMTAAAGVKLGRVVTFSEGYNYMPYSAGYKTMATDSVMAPQSPTPAIEPGSREVSLNVSVTYEIE